MKTTPILHICAALAATATLASAQGGPLTPPPGAPAPTMKSLDQVEPRIPLVTGAPGVTIGTFGTITISQPGSYYLTGNLQINGNTNGIVINASGVNLDLMGYSILAPASGNAADGINIQSNHGNIHIQNGHIHSTTTFSGSSFTTSGFNRGIATLAGVSNIFISNITIRGTRTYGIYVNGHNGIVEKCSVFIAAGAGIDNLSGTVADSHTHATGSTGIASAVVSNCKVKQSLGNGISAEIVLNSYTYSTISAFHGIIASSVENSFGITSGLHGISAISVSNSRGETANPSINSHGILASGGRVSGSRGVSAGGHGIMASSVSNSTGFSSGANSANSCGIYAERISNCKGTASSVSGGTGITSFYTVTASYGISAGQQGILSFGSVSDSFGSSGGNTATSVGIDTYIAITSFGRSTNASGRQGIVAYGMALNSIGESSGSSGIYAQRSASNCYGYTDHTANTSHGILSAGLVSNSYGFSNGSNSGDGINAPIVKGSYGYAITSARHGISATLAESSIGQRAAFGSSKFGIVATRANFCRGFHDANTTSESTTNKYNMP